MQTESACQKTMTLPWQPPLVLAEKIRKLGHFVWFDSNINPDTQSPIRKGMHRPLDIMTASPEIMVYTRGNQLEVHEISSGERTVIHEDPFLFLDNLLKKYPITNTDTKIPFTGGLAGFWGYEMNHSIEPEQILERRHSMHDGSQGLYLWSLTIDHDSKQLVLTFQPGISENKRRIILDAIQAEEEEYESPFCLHEPFKASITFEEYLESFEKIKAYIHAGDCYQVNLTQCFSAGYEGDLWNIYRLLRAVSPSPFSAWFDSGAMQISSHSPERFLKVEGTQVKTSPIKGTRPRSSSATEDRMLAEELLASTKEKAENLMIVDLLRNDLNRFCEQHSVKVNRLFALESYANVHHMVSHIEGKLKPGITALELLKNSFPGGSVTGAPKIRAMQIIRELEPTPRMTYCGAIGYISFNGNMDTSIPIRTLVGDGKTLHCWGGGAIVADSIATSEYEESIVKISNLTSALEQHFIF